MTEYDINKAYISPYDQFLFAFDAEHPKSVSQRKEIEKHKRIAALRDNPRSTLELEEIWVDF